jgi:hypothetical protein
VSDVVKLDHKGHRFPFTGDRRDAFTFWRVESEGRVYPSPMEVSGEETPDFFRALADAALEHGFDGG